MHVGIAYLRWRGKRSRHSRRMRIRNLAYLVRGLLRHVVITSWGSWWRSKHLHLTNDGVMALQWRHNGHDCVSNHQPYHCLHNRLFNTDQRKHQSSASLAFVRGIHRGPVNSPHKWPVTRKTFPFDDVIMKRKRFSHYLPLVRGIHRLPLSPRKGPLMQRFDNFFYISPNTVVFPVKWTPWGS